MLDIKYIMGNKDEVITKLNSRNKDFTAAVNEAVELYDEYTNVLPEVEKLKAEQKNFGKDDIENAKANKAKIVELEAQAKELKTKLDDVILGLPNMPVDEVPVGTDEDANQEIYTWGDEYKLVGDNYKHHFELTDEIDFEKGARLAKARFAVIMNETAKKEREIMNLMLDNAAEFGYTEVGVPQVASQDTLLCAGQLPKFADDVFKLDARADIAAENNEDLKDLYLIPTAETQLANLYRGQIIDQPLPLKYCAYTRCFRSEAGSGGRDTRGLIRMHEFGKVELFQYVEPEKSMDALEEMCEASEAVLRKLKLPYRKLLLCTGDMGAGARKTYDLEVWFPGQQCYREVASISNVGDFQSRRGKIRYKNAEGKTVFPHMLNGSALATGRILAATIENSQE